MLIEHLLLEVSDDLGIPGFDRHSSWLGASGANSCYRGFDYKTEAGLFISFLEELGLVVQFLDYMAWRRGPWVKITFTLPGCWAILIM
jgi:hypothetical protein